MILAPIDQIDLTWATLMSTTMFRHLGMDEIIEPYWQVSVERSG